MCKKHHSFAWYIPIRIILIMCNYCKKNYDRWIDQPDISVAQRKNLSPRQESNPWPPKHMAGTLSTELWELMVWRVRSFNWVHVTGILHSVRNSTIKVIVCSDKWIKMVNFKLGNEMWTVNWSNRSVSGLRFFSLSHNCVMLINSPFTLYYRA